MPALSDKFAPSRLRCVFDDAVMSFPLGARPTLGDVADLLNAPTVRRRGPPRSIDIAWPSLRAARPGRPLT